MINKLKDNLMLKKLSVTIFYLLLFQIGTNTLLPFIDRSVLLKLNPSTLSNVALLSGASLDSFSILTLGISPYILSSMAMQILGMGIIPQVKKWKEEGRSGRQKIDMMTKGIAILMAFIQGWVLLSTRNATLFLLPDTRWQTYLGLSALLTIGTMISIWIAGQITSNGIGNGSSVLILASISTGLFKNFFTGYTAVQEADGNALLQLGVYLTLWVIMFFVTLMVELLQKPHLIRYNLGTGKDCTTNYNIKLNNAGIMPLLFASIATSLINTLELGVSKWILYPLMFIVVVLFTYVYTYQSINPKELSKDFQINHLYFDGISTKKDTVSFLKKRILLLTGLNAVVLLVYMVLPTIVNTITKMQIGDFVEIGGTTFLVFVSIVVQMYDSLNSTRTEQNIEKLF